VDVLAVTCMIFLSSEPALKFRLRAERSRLSGACGKEEEKGGKIEDDRKR
jgi:hypothetical protein